MAVVTITADYSAYALYNPFDLSTSKTAHTINFGIFVGTARAAARFSLSTARSIAPTKVELIVEVGNSSPTPSGSSNIRSYGTNGQGNPETDSASTLLNRANGTTPYLGTTSFNTDGVKTIDISGAQLFTDIVAAKSGGRFSLGFTHEVTSSGNVTLKPDTDGTNPPKLRLTYPDTFSPFFWNLF